MTDLTHPTAAIVIGVRHTATKLGLKTEQSLAVAAASDPLALQVGADLGRRLIEGQPTSLSEVKACQANKACVAGMVTSVEADTIGGDGFVEGGLPPEVVVAVQRNPAQVKAAPRPLSPLRHAP